LRLVIASTFGFEALSHEAVLLSDGGS